MNAAVSCPGGHIRITTDIDEATAQYRLKSPYPSPVRLPRYPYAVCPYCQSPMRWSPVRQGVS